MVHGSYQIMIMIIYIYSLISLGPRDTTDHLVQFSKGIVYVVDHNSLSLSKKNQNPLELSPTPIIWVGNFIPPKIGYLVCI